MITTTAIVLALVASSVTATPVGAPKCCFISTSEFDAFSPTAQVCSKTADAYSCPAGLAHHNGNHKFLSFVVPSANAGSDSIAFVAECRNAAGKAVMGKPILCETGATPQEMSWDQNIMNGGTCVETSEDPFRIVQFTPKTAGLKC